jgi:hypothetical protein
LPRILEEIVLIAEDDGINFMLLKKIYSPKTIQLSGPKTGEAVDICAIIKHICSIYGYKNASIKWF